VTVRTSPLNNDLQGVLLTPDHPTGLGVVVLGGSSGRVDVDRARLFAERSALAIAMRWFGGEGQAPSVCEIPLESFGQAIELLQQRGCRRVAFVGTSKGAEAALLLAANDPRVDVVVAVSPGSAVWASTGDGIDGPSSVQRSSFTLADKPWPFVPYDETAMAAIPPEPPFALLDAHLRSLERAPDRVAAATIPIERSDATIVLVAGGDDALWPSARFADEIAARLAAHGKRAYLITRPDAGHRVLFPGETTPRSTRNLHGGTDEADRALGKDAWRVIAEVLGFEP
jgi:dienelactone hydrolase